MRLLPEGLRRVEQAAPMHVATVRRFVIDALTPQQVDALRGITDAILRELDPTGVMAATLRNRA